MDGQRWLQFCAIFMLSACSKVVLADKALDAELDAEWGSDHRVKAKVINTPESTYGARVQTLVAKRSRDVHECEARSNEMIMICRHIAEDQYRQALRSLRDEFKDKMKELPPEPRVRENFDP